MGYVRAEIRLRNPKEGSLREVAATALVDTGSLMLCLPEAKALQLGLDLAGAVKRQVTTADGSHHLVPYAGPVEVLFEDRNCFVGALIMGDEVLLGAVPMEDMDLIVSPAHRKLVVNPDFPNFPHALVK
ncbi:MAG: clan AA aspartic protease [Verrucomicrobia bacterium]|nr:clan AA aspartic protease [Verrucomicrobiota bacterium]